MSTTDHPVVAGPDAIFVIRHGEKPPDPSSAELGVSTSTGPPYGVDINGQSNADSLIPQGWQRAGGLASLFDPKGSLARGTGLATPTVIASPNYGNPPQHRTFETVLPLALKLNLTPDTSFAIGSETDLVNWALDQIGATVLICWEHDHIIDITRALQKVRTVQGPVPGHWPGHRFDIVVALQANPERPGEYVCTQVAQLLLAGDSSKHIHHAAP